VYKRQGDYFVWLHGTENPVCRFYKTRDVQTLFFETDGSGVRNFSAREDGHYVIRDYIHDSTRVFDNTADDVCLDRTKPTWPNDPSLDTLNVKGSSVLLAWKGDTDNIEVTNYRIFQGGNKVKEIDKSRICEIKELTPLTAYTFKVEAGDEAGNWSTTGPQRTVTTKTDTKPVWVNGTLTVNDKTETKLTLSWNGAKDDYGIEFYHIYKDEAEIEKIGGGIKTWEITSLDADTTYTFRIEAEDGAKQLSVNGPVIEQKMPPPERPYWKEGEVLLSSEITETTMKLSWPFATDQFDEVKVYKIFRDDEWFANISRFKNEVYATGLEEGKIYLFKVFAYDESGNESKPPLSAEFSTLPPFVVEPLITDPADQIRPDICGNIVVWQDKRNDDGDIYMYNLEAEIETRLTNNPATQSDPRISGEGIVWIDNRYGNPDIYLYDPELGEIPVCTSPGNQSQPAIDGDIIVWCDDRNGNYDIYMYDLKTMTESSVCTRSSDQINPDVWFPWVVYEDNRNGNRDIYMYNIYSKKELVICKRSGDQTNPSVSGGKYFSDLGISYTDRNDIYVYYPFFLDMTDLDYKVPIDDFFISVQRNPHMKDMQQVFEDNLGGDGSKWDIYAFNFYPAGHGKKIPVCVEPLSDQRNPRTSKKNIVWEDDRHGNKDIYIWRRPRGSDLQLALTMHPDPAMVGDTIKYILKLINNGPNSNLFINTTVALPVMAKYISSKKDKGEVIIEGKDITWNIDTLRFGTETNLEITMVTYDIAILEFRAETKGGAFETDPSNNQVYEKTKVKNVVAKDVDEGETPAMVVEDSGKVHLAYFCNDTLMYTFRNRLDRKWEYRKLGFCDHSQNLTMVMAPDRNLHVIYSDYNWECYPRSRLFHGVITPAGEWSSKIIDLSDRGFHSIALDINSEGELYLAWLEAPGAGGPAAIMIRRTVNGAWQTARLVFEKGFENVDLNVDMEGNVHLSFYHLSNKSNILHQKWSGDLEAGTVERIEPEWGSFPAGMEVFVTAKGTSITSNNLNEPYISYAGYANNDPLENINYAWKQDNTWHFGKVDEGSYNHSINKLTIDPEGILNIGYYHYPAKQLRFATSIAATWTRQIIDDDTTASWRNLNMDMDGDHYGHLALGVTYGGTASLPSPLPPLHDLSRVKYILIPQLVYLNTDPDSLDFGTVETGTEKTLSLILSNPSEQKITIDTIAINDPRFRFNKTSFVLERFSEDIVNVTFSQTENKGLETWLRIVYNSPSDVMMELPVKVSSWGPTLIADPDTVLFGAVPVNTLATQTINLQNNGLADLIFPNLEVKYELWPGYPVETDFTLAGHNCSTLEPGQSCEVQVSFQPTKDGTQNSFLNISSNDPETPEMKISISGNTPFAQLFTKKSSIDFGYCPFDAILPDTLILLNSGDAVLNITSINLSGSDADQFDLAGSCTSIAPGDSCSIQVMINPTREDDFIAELVITSNSLWSEVLNIPLSGTSFIRTLELSTENINFGNVHVGDQSFVLLELSNTGSVEININQITLNGPDRYEFKNNHACYQIAAGATCIDTVWFAPIFEGEKTGTLVINSNDSYKPVQIVVLTGHAGPALPLQASITASPESGLEPLSVQFSSADSGGNPPYSYLWDFDDMRTTSGASPVHEFGSIGVYNVSMRISDAFGNSVIETIKITVTTIPDNSLAGELYDETGSININYSDVILIPESDISDTTLLIFEGTNSYHFTGLESGQYTILAIPDSLTYPQDLPTYLGDKLALYEADWINVTGHITGKDIRLIKKPALGSGSGSISGNLVSGSGKGLTVTEKTENVSSDPVPDVNVYLKRTTDGKLMAYDITGSDGSFKFEGLENGSYYFVADYQGKPMDDSNSPLVINDTRNSLDILAIVGTEVISVEDITTGIDDVNIKGIKVYPVPAGNHIMVEIPEGLFMSITVRMKILDLSGKYVFIDNKYETTGNPIILNIEFLNNGMHLLEISDKTRSHRVKIVKLK